MQAEKCMVGGQKASWGLSGWCQRPLAPIPVEFLRVPVLIWISDLSSLPCCSPEELMKQPLEDVFLFLHRVLSRRSTAASVASCYMGHSAALRSYRCPKRAGPLPRQAVLERLQGSWDVGSWGRRRTRGTERQQEGKVFGISWHGRVVPSSSCCPHPWLSQDLAYFSLAPLL